MRFFYFALTGGEGEGVFCVGGVYSDRFWLCQRMKGCKAARYSYQVLLYSEYCFLLED